MFLHLHKLFVCARSVREKTASAAAQITPVDGHGMRKLQSRNQRERDEQQLILPA